MYRIKTDIRQYKCESREKVERLIRNWVVRPTDLIFYDEQQEWGPIGEHDEFASTFAELADEEEADTIVTDEEPPVAGDGDEVEDTEEELEPPEPPEGVEPGRADPDEITVMTEETLESYLEEDEAPRHGEIPVVDGESDDEVSDDAPTNPEVEPPEEADRGAAVPVGASREPETTGAEGMARSERPTDPEIPGAEAPGDGLREAARAPDDTWPESEEAAEGSSGAVDELGDEPGPAEWEVDAEAPKEGAVDSEAAESEYEISDEMRAHRSGDQRGRHDLPEEVFVTNEFEGGEEEGLEAPVGSGSRLDSGDATDAREVEEALQKNAEAARQKHVDDEWDDILDRLRQTDELSSEEIEEITQTRDEIDVSRDEGDSGEFEEVPEEVEEYVSEAYDRELPISVGPTRRDVQLGIPDGPASERRRDRTFPYPQPKQEGKVAHRSFTLRTPRDLSIAVIVGVFAFVLVLIAVAVSLA